MVFGVARTNRSAVLAAVEASTAPLTGREVSLACALGYKQTIDALDALYNYGLVRRVGRKFTARWTRKVDAQPRPLLDDVMYRMCAAMPDREAMP